MNLSPISTNVNSAAYEHIDANMAAVSAQRLANKLVEQVSRTPNREPSPQPMHVTVNGGHIGGNGYRVIRSATVGYVAPKFDGKTAQMSQG